MANSNQNNTEKMDTGTDKTCHGQWMSEEYEPGLVSVIITTYNRVKFLVEAMISVFAQTYRPIELIVVDDGSTDNTKDMVRHNILLESAAHSESLEKILNFKESGFELIKYFAEKYNVTSDVKRESYSRFITGISNLAYKLNNDKKIEELATEKPLSKIVMLKLSLLLIGLRKRLLYKPIGLIVKMINVIERNVK